MTHQPSFSQAEFATKKKTTRREKFLTRMEALIPWTKLLAVIEPFYPKGERGRPPVGLERMLRIYFLQQWYGLADEALEDALYDSQALQGFARIDLCAEGVPDATTLLKFRRLLETHDLCQGLFSAINADLAARGLLLREGTLVDATLIAAPPSTKNRAKQRDPEMHQTRKGNQWYFGMKAHIGADRDSKVVHTVVVTAANVADLTQTARRSWRWNGRLTGRSRASVGQSKRWLRARRKRRSKRPRSSRPQCAPSWSIPSTSSRIYSATGKCGIAA
jgi:IS5 family transposase